MDSGSIADWVQVALGVLSLLVGILTLLIAALLDWDRLKDRWSGIPPGVVRLVRGLAIAVAILLVAWGVFSLGVQRGSRTGSAVEVTRLVESQVTRLVEVTREVTCVAESTSITEVPTASPCPTNTPYPTYTPYPTHTPYPTYTPMSTPAPTPTPSPSHTPTPATVRTSFDGNSLYGWKVAGAQITGVTNPGSGGSGGGENNGCLIWKDHPQDLGLVYFSAPSKFLGDWRSYSALRFDVWSSGGEFFETAKGDVYIESGVASAWRNLGRRPAESWETFTIPLEDDGTWEFSGGAGELQDVLVNVTLLRIRAELGKSGYDTTGLDNVELVP